MSPIHSTISNAVAYRTETSVPHRAIAQRLSLPDDQVRRIARRLLHLGLARDELARLSGHELNRLVRRRRHRHVHRCTGGSA